MNVSTPFIRRPVGTTLLTVAITLAGALGYFSMPVSALPEVDFPTLEVSASLPGASPETMASAVATPLERQFGRIAGITEMTSTSSLGSTSIMLQFDLNRNIDAAAREVQAAINAARSQLPADLPGNPSYRKVNSSEVPIMGLSLTSDTYDKIEMYEVASTIIQQKLSQVNGVGQVRVSGSATPAVRVSINPTLLNHFGLGLEDVRDVLSNANANRPKGQLADERRSWSISATDQLDHAKQYEPLVVAYRNGAPIRLDDVATVTDSAVSMRAIGLWNGQPAILLHVSRQPGANIIETVDNVRALLPQLQAAIPAGMTLNMNMDRTVTIRASVHEVKITMLISIVLVILVIFAFLRSVRATIIPSVAVPVSLMGTFGVIYLAGYSINNLSLMALTIATGFVVDDAIVVIENITRYIEKGDSPLEASLKGAREIGFTVLSISASLVAVFIPILMMGGLVGRLFREFAVTLSVAIAVSLIVSLTTTPMMCARLLKRTSDERHGWLYNASEWIYQWVLDWYAVTLVWVLRWQKLTLLVALGAVALSVYLYIIVPKGFFPQQDAGRLIGSIQPDQDASFQTVERLVHRFSSIVSEDPAVESVTGFAGEMSGGSARMFLALKPIEERGGATADQIIARLRSKLSQIPGATLFLQSVQELRVGARSSSAQYQYTLQSDNLKDLQEWSPKMLQAIRKLPGLVDVNSNQQNRGLQASVTIDRLMAARLGITPEEIDNTLYDAFGQRQVSTIYTSLNQHFVVMEVDSAFAQGPEALRYIYLRGRNGVQVPLSAVASYSSDTTSVSVNHSGQFPSVTMSFNLTPGTTLAAAVAAIEQLESDLGLPSTVKGSFSGTAQVFQASLSTQPLLILTALISVYIVLGVLYESYIHPITILSTLPSAGVGAILALLVTGSELSVIALIGIILLIGIVKKNAILMIDFALDAERREGKSSFDAIHEACLLRFRPIMMTTMAALLGAVPLALGNGVGSELRRPLGITIIGGLIVSQMLTLYTTPVVYLFLDRIRLRREAPPLSDESVKI